MADSYILPHNPLVVKDLLAEAKKLKGDKTWLEFDLECLLAKYPNNKKFSDTLASIKAKAESPKPVKPSKAAKKPKAQALEAGKVSKLVPGQGM